jgi:uncharacterized protein (TIGR02118 family)
MVKMIFVIRRLPHLSPEEFHRYWREQHGSLAKKNLPALRVKRYVQTHTLDTPLNEVMRDSRGGGEPYDGVVEIWWDSVEDLEGAFASPEGAQASEELLEDERRFIDLPRSSMWLAKEEVFIEGQGESI